MALIFDLFPNNVKFANLPSAPALAVCVLIKSGLNSLMSFLISKKALMSEKADKFLPRFSILLPPSFSKLESSNSF